MTLQVVTFLALGAGLLNLYFQSSHWPGSEGKSLSVPDLAFWLLYVLVLGSFLTGSFWLIDFIQHRIRARKRKVGFYRKWLIGLIVSAVLLLWLLPGVI